jgi:hypothetical protein
MIIGIYDMDVFGEALVSDEGHITVDFLNETSTGAAISIGLAWAICRYRDAVPEMCAKHSIDPGEIKTLVARFGTDPAYGPHFKVTVENTQGKASTDQYVGIPGKRLLRVPR